MLQLYVSRWNNYFGTVYKQSRTPCCKDMLAVIVTLKQPHTTQHQATTEMQILERRCLWLSNGNVAGTGRQGVIQPYDLLQGYDLLSQPGGRFYVESPALYYGIPISPADKARRGADSD
jgi:hypothetical protein